MGKISSRSLVCPDFEKLVTIRPVQGFTQLDVSTLILFTHSRSFEEQRGSWRIKWIYLKIFNNIPIQVDLARNSNIEWQTTTLSQNSFFVFSSCAIVKRFYSLTFSSILAKAKKGISSFDLFQYIYVIFSLSDQPNWFLSIA